MAIGQGDSFTSHNFGLQIDGVMVEYLSEVTGLTVEQEVIRNVQNTAGGKYSIGLLPGPPKEGQCTVVRGMTDSAAFTEWIRASLAGEMDTARKNATIVVNDFVDAPAKRYHMRNAWCSKVETSALKAGEASALTETVTIVFEELVIE